MKVRTGDSTVPDVADDQNSFSRKIAQVVLHDEKVKECLRGVFMSAVPGIDDRSVTSLRHQFRTTVEPTAHHDHINPHRIELKRGVDERLAFRHTRTGRGQVDGVTPESNRSRFKGTASSGRVLEKEIGDHAAIEFVSSSMVAQSTCIVENQLDLEGGHAFESQQVLILIGAPGHDARCYQPGDGWTTLGSFVHSGLSEEMSLTGSQIGDPEKIKTLLRPDSRSDFGDRHLGRVPIELEILGDFQNVPKEQVS